MGDGGPRVALLYSNPAQSSPSVWVFYIFVFVFVLNFTDEFALCG